MQVVESVESRTSEPGLVLRWQALREQQPGIRARDAAVSLGVSEAELVAAGCGGDAVRLAPRWAALLQDVGSLGRVMALTRNEQVVHEKIGVYENISAEGRVGLALGSEIDLRLFFDRWKHGFAVGLPGHPRPSLQFFDATGTAVHKIHLIEASDRAAFDALVERYRHDDQSTAVAATPPKARVPTADGAVDVAAYRARWDALEDTHDFFGLLRAFKLDRPQAMRLAGTERAQAVPRHTLRRLLIRAAEIGTPIMVFVGNPGCIQIHSGPIHTLKDAGPWLNVLDPGFNLHLREDRIGTSWVVWKPTRDGTVTSLEIFDAAGETMALLFGVRKPGQVESDAWRALVAEVAAERPGGAA